MLAIFFIYRQGRLMEHNHTSTTQAEATVQTPIIIFT